MKVDANYTVIITDTLLPPFCLPHQGACPDQVKEKVVEKKSFLSGEPTGERVRDDSAERKTVIPVLQEELDVSKRKVDAGATRVSKIVHEREETVDMPLLEEEAQVERVPVNAVLDAPATIRQEGDVTVVPLMEEVLVVQKKLLLREELRITKRKSTVSKPQTETLRSEEVVVERTREPGERKR